jgi:hypothetical protein
MAETLASGAEREPRFRFSQLLPTLVFDVAMPILVFNLLTDYGVSTLLALLAAGISPALNNLRVWIRSRRLEALGISGSVFFALIKDSLLTGTFGLICLVSLLAARPLLFYIVRQFVAGDDAVRIAWWNRLWEFPAFRKSIRFVTAVWGIVYICEACLRVAFALTLPPADVVRMSPIMSFGALVLLIIWTRRYMIGVRERNQPG